MTAYRTPKFHMIVSSIWLICGQISREYMYHWFKIYTVPKKISECIKLMILIKNKIPEVSFSESCVIFLQWDDLYKGFQFLNFL